MFNLFYSSFKLRTTTPAFTSEDGVNYLEAKTEQVVKCFWQNITQDNLKIVGGQIVKGQLLAGDAVAIIKDSSIDWTEIVKINNEVEKDGQKYRIVSATKRPRNWTHLELKRLEG
jgi:hypothetical protein